MGLLDKLQSKLELYRLEQKYAKRKNRTTFTTGAQYVDGEYVYSTNSNDSNSNAVSSSPISASSTGSSSLSQRMKRNSSWMGKR